MVPLIARLCSVTSLKDYFHIQKHEALWAMISVGEPLQEMNTQQRLSNSDVKRANRVVEDKMYEILRCTILHAKICELQRIQSCWRPTVKLHKRSPPPFEFEHFCLPPHLYCMQPHHKVSESH